MTNYKKTTEIIDSDNNINNNNLSIDGLKIFAGTYETKMNEFNEFKELIQEFLENNQNFSLENESLLDSYTNNAFMMYDHKNDTISSIIFDDNLDVTIALQTLENDSLNQKIEQEIEQTKEKEKENELVEEKTIEAIRKHHQQNLIAEVSNPENITPITKVLNDIEEGKSQEYGLKTNVKAEDILTYQYLEKLSLLELHRELNKLLENNNCEINEPNEKDIKKVGEEQYKEILKELLNPENRIQILNILKFDKVKDFQLNDTNVRLNIEFNLTPQKETEKFNYILRTTNKEDRKTIYFDENCKIKNIEVNEKSNKSSSITSPRVG